MSKYKMPKIEDLLEAGVHYGHQTKRWHPGMEPYIYSASKGIHIIDLEQTLEKLKEAADFLYETAKNGGRVIFVGTKKQARDTVENEARRAGALYVTERWLGGTFTNFSVIKKNNTDKLLDLKSRKESGDLAKYTKKERLLIDREIELLEKYVGGLVTMTKIPKAMVVIDAKREKTAVAEARKSSVKVVALVDTNTDPRSVDFPIPANDDAIKAIAVITRVLADAVEAGNKEYTENLSKGKVSETHSVQVSSEVDMKEISPDVEATPKTDDVPLSEETQAVLEKVEEVLEKEKLAAADEVKPAKKAKSSKN